MAFSFDLFKYVSTDPNTAALAGATSLLDYYGQKDAYKKNKAYLAFQKAVLEQSQIAQENGVAFNTYLTNSVIKQQARQAETRQMEVSAQSVAKGAAIGQQGSASALVARNAQFQQAAVSGQRDLSIQKNIEQSQVKLDNITLNYDAKLYDLDYKIENLDSPSIFSSIVDTTESIYSQFKKFERDRLVDESYANDKLNVKLK